MPIIKSAIKDLKRTASRTQRNRAARGKLRSNLKRVRVAVVDNQPQLAQQALAGAVPIIDRAVTKGILHKNAAARHKARLVRQVNRLTRPTPS